MFARSHSYKADYSSRHPWTLKLDGEAFRCRSEAEARADSAKFQAVVMHVDRETATVYAMTVTNPKLPMARRGGQHCGSVTTE